jgi:G3E family GTPase
VCVVQMRNKTYDHIVIETTGVAEPKAIRNNFQMAEDYGNKLINYICDYM